MLPAFSHVSTADSDVIDWPNWASRWGLGQYLVLVGVGMQGVLLGAATAVFVRWTVGWWWLAVAAVWLLLAGWLMRQVRPILGKRRLVITATSWTIADIDPWRTTTRRFTPPEIFALRYEQKQWEPVTMLIYRARPFGRETLEILTHYPIAPWLHPADQHTLHQLLTQILAKRGWRVLG
jgi:hypothetical protein